MNFSIITPIYNHAHYFDRYLMSIIKQLGPEDEIILIDDASTDNLKDVLEDTKKIWYKKMVVVRNISKISGPSYCRNLGINISKNNWIKFLDADDQLAPDALKNLSPFLSEPGVYIGWQQTGNAQYPPALGVIDHVNPFVPSMTCIHKSILEEVNGFDSKIYFEEDWDLWLRIRERFTDRIFHQVNVLVDIFNDNVKERSERDRFRSHEVNGQDVREYIKEKYDL